MIDVAEKATIEYSVADCRHLNRLEMIGIISCDIMHKKYHEDIKEHFRHIFKGATMGPWTIQANPTDNSIIFKIDTPVEYRVVFIPRGRLGISVQYWRAEERFLDTCWSMEELDEILSYE